jgi:hypothetical protein
LVRESNLPTEFGFKIGAREIPLTSSRVGIVKMGELYAKKKRSGAYVLPSVMRQSTLIHEARHSDCTGGITKADIERYKQDEMIENSKCGYMHSICPKGHQYEGYYACDDMAWGAYSVEAVYTAFVDKSCGNCTEAEKQVALAGAIDALSRVMVADDMLAGKLGEPDMSSSGVIK